MCPPRTNSSAAAEADPETRPRPSHDTTDIRARFGARSQGLDLDGPIAAIGTNTGGSGGHAYVVGFGFAAQILLRSLTRRGWNEDPDDLVPEDALIYPLAYCTRHFVELFLKDIPQEIHALRGVAFRSEEHHAIDELWVAFEAACALDRRLREFPERLRDSVMAIAALDPTGQTFRYRRDKDDELHLKDLAIIYVRQFEQSYMAMFEAVKDMYSLVEALQLEYVLGTYTENLSRFDLREIAQRIGQAAKEGKEALRATQAKICTDFSLSRSQYQLARDQIEQHHELSQLAGRERPLKELTPEILGVAFLAIFEDDAAALLSQAELAAIWGVLYAADTLGASEDYDPQRQAFLDYTIPTAGHDVLRRLRNKPTHIRKGLGRLGQSTLQQAWDSMVPSEELRLIEEYGKHGIRLTL
jgi:hypothetical protein